MSQAADVLDRIPLPPSDELWQQAVADVRRGMFVTVDVKTPTGVASVSLTRTFQRALSTIGFVGTERIVVNSACLLIAKDMDSPMLTAEPIRVAREPLGARMASPLDGVTITWQPNPRDPGNPMVMTLERH